MTGGRENRPLPGRTDGVDEVPLERELLALEDRQPERLVVQEGDPAGLEERNAGLTVVLPDRRLHLPLVDEIDVELQGCGRLRVVRR